MEPEPATGDTGQGTKTGRPRRRPSGAALACLALTSGLLLAAQPGGAAREERAVQAPLAAQSLLLDVAGTAGRLVAVGERGHILVSADEGRTWRQADVATRALLTGVFMLDDRRGWAVGHDQVIVRTRDGGATWERVHAAPEREQPLLDVWFADASAGVAVGAYGSLLATADGGDTWEARTVYGDDDFHVNQIAAAPDGTLWLAAEAGHVYRSRDRGATWQPVVSPYEGSFFGVLPLSNGSLLVFGLRGHLFRSTDLGATWTAMPTGTEETLTCALELGEGRFVIGGMGGTLLWSDAAGTAVRLEELPDRKAIVALARGAAGGIAIFGEGGARLAQVPR